MKYGIWKNKISFRKLSIDEKGREIWTKNTDKVTCESNSVTWIISLFISPWRIFFDDCHLIVTWHLRRLSNSQEHKMAANAGDSAGTSAPPEPDSSENAPLLQEQDDRNENLGPPPPFVASKWIYNHYKLFSSFWEETADGRTSFLFIFEAYYEIFPVSQFGY